MANLWSRRALLVAGCLVACHKKARISHAPPPRPARPPRIGDTETGVASWYGHPYHGRQAANGEIYDMEKLTAAHRTLPFNTWVRVQNLANDASVDLRIIDRGPFVGNRIIDVSHEAARQLVMLGSGITNVKLTVIASPTVPEAAIFAVQVGLFRNHDNAVKLQADLQARYGASNIVERQGGVPTWRVLAGREATPEAAEALAVRIRGDISVPEAYVVRLDQP